MASAPGRIVARRLGSGMEDACCISRYARTLSRKVVNASAINDVMPEEIVVSPGHRHLRIRCLSIRTRDIISGDWKFRQGSVVRLATVTIMAAAALNRTGDRGCCPQRLPDEARNTC